ncbi:hypothetical protein H4R34_000302 [Dimargaris verticillata]|uniref:Prolyl 4-hydroxylase alpha subunit domain-containing protein n=1 Tax=Dimargaris verticillata TaxID=2761393 RepID=A0A9W8EBE4_9FUNG|nr:hypothetical protein H4R34_000302 [Dimargaris verticillata]
MAPGRRHTKAATAAVTKSRHPPSKALRWPTICHPRPALTLHQVITDHVFTIPRFFTPQECHAWLVFAEQQLGFPPVPPNVRPRKGEAFRNNARVAVDDNAMAQRLWRETGLASLLTPWAVQTGRSLGSGGVFATSHCALQPCSGAVIMHAQGLNANLRLYRYAPGQRFEQHYDDSVTDAQRRTSEFTLLIYLNAPGTDPLNVLASTLTARPVDPAKAGGQTVFYANQGQLRVPVTPQQGMALLHRHGAHCLLHEGLAVHHGVKYILRSDIMFAPEP